MFVRHDVTSLHDAWRNENASGFASNRRVNRPIWRDGARDHRVTVRGISCRCGLSRTAPDMMPRRSRRFIVGTRDGGMDRNVHPVAAGAAIAAVDAQGGPD